MIEVAGEVIAVDGRRALVRTQVRSGGCGRCGEPGGCGGAGSGADGGPRSADFWLENDIDATIGERVLVCVTEDASLSAAFLGYLIPVLGIVLGAGFAVFASGSEASDGHALIGALGGLVLGMLVSRGLGRSGAGPVEPVLRRPTEESCR